MSAINEQIINIIKSNKFLSIREFLHDMNYEHNILYLDKFWNNIKDDKWIYLDNELISWMGYKDLRRGKEGSIKLLKQYFTETEDFKILNKDDFSKNEYSFIDEDKEDMRGAHKRIYITLSADCFRELCTHIGTSKAKEINKYLLNLEKIFKMYMNYQIEYNKFQKDVMKQELEIKNNLIEEQKKELDELISIQQKTVQPLKREEYIYVATNKINIKSNVFKIGKSTNIKSRISTFNINALHDNEFYYTFIFKCHNSRILESIIHTFLKPFNYKNELFQLHYTPLHNIVKEITNNYNSMTNMVNNYIDKEYINDLSLERFIPDKVSKYNISFDKDGEECFDIKDEEENIIQQPDEAEMNIIGIEKNIFLYNGVKLFICPKYCGLICKERSIMRDHLCRVYKCTPTALDENIVISDNKNENTIKYVEDLIQKNNVNLSICEFCNKHFISVSKLERHKHSEESCKQEYKCERCNSVFHLKGDYNVHTRNIYCLDKDGNVLNKEEAENELKELSNKIISEDPSIYYVDGIKFHKCVLCNKPFNNKNALKYHLNKKVKCNETFNCTKCNRTFHTNDNLTKHLNQKTDCTNNVFKCPKCNNLFASNRGLLKHIKNVVCVK